MANWPALSPIEQQEKLAEITQEILLTLPQGWSRLVLRAKMIGPHSEADTGVKMTDGTIRYNRDETPKFDTAPMPENFATEQKWFPRADEHMPQWFRTGLATAGT